MKKRIFTGAGVALVTPMNQDLSINYDVLGGLIDWQIEQHTDCIITCGTTSESSTMTDQEHIDCIKFTVERVNGRVPVVAGTGSNHTDYAIEMSKEAKNLGVDGLLHVTPYYNKCSQKGLARHFSAIADATDLPIILYNVPSRTGVNISIETYKELDRHKNIVATKEASGNISLVAEIKASCEMDVYTGNDDQIVPIMSLGGIGAISVLSNVMPRATHDIVSLYLEGKTSESSKLQLALLPLIHSLFCDVNPIPVKEMLNLMGKNVGGCRLPLCETDDKCKQIISDAVKAFKL